MDSFVHALINVANAHEVLPRTAQLCWLILLWLLAVVTKLNSPLGLVLTQWNGGLEYVQLAIQM